MIGIPPPAGMPRENQASWYWDEIQRAEKEHWEDCPTPAADCPTIQNLIFGAIQAGVIGHCIPVAGFTDPQPFHSLVAPFRTRPGGAAEREEAERRRVLDRPVPRRFRAGDPA